MRHLGVDAELCYKVSANTWRLEEDALLEVIEQLRNEVVVRVDQVPNADPGAVSLALERGQQVPEGSVALWAGSSSLVQQLGDDAAKERHRAAWWLAATGDVNADLEHQLQG